MKKSTSKDFWESWVKADELEKIKLIKTLPLFRGGNTFKYMNATLLNSYLVDLYNHMREKT